MMINLIWGNELLLLYEFLFLWKAKMIYETVIVFGKG